MLLPFSDFHLQSASAGSEIKAMVSGSVFRFFLNGPSLDCKAANCKLVLWSDAVKKTRISSMN